MKNKKIISLTAAMIAVVLIGVLGLSRFFETTWQQPEQVDNSLSVDITDTKNESVFDYPYKYMSEISVEDTEFLRMDYVVDYSIDALSDGMISYQQAVNISGEALKFLYGCTEHQSDYSVIDLINMDAMYADRDFEVYKDKLYCYVFGKRYNDETSIIFQCLVEPYTGEIVYCWARDYRDLTELDQEMSYIPIAEITESDIQNITKKAQDVLDIVRTGSSIKQLKKLEYSNMVSRGRVLAAAVELTDGTLLQMTFDTQYNNNYQLVEYFIPYTSAMEEELK